MNDEIERLLKTVHEEIGRQPVMVTPAGLVQFMLIQQATELETIAESALVTPGGLRSRAKYLRRLADEV